VIDRRHLLALAGGAAVTASLPGEATEQPFLSDLDYRVLLLFRDLDDDEQEAWLRGLRRIVAGMPINEAGRLMFAELGREPPAGLLP
jgi:hypothetical protein